MGKPWTTEPQKEWLMSKRDDFYAARAASRMPRFQITTHKEFFDRWPERAVVFPSKSKEEALSAEEQGTLALAVIARRGQLNSWFYNNTVQKSNGGKHALGLLSAVTSSSGGSAPKKRAPQAIEIYQKRFADKIAPIIAEKRKIINATSPAEGLAVRREVTQKLWNEESQEVRDAILKELSEWKKTREAELLQLNTMEAQGFVSRTPKEYETALKAMPEMLNNMLQKFSEATGWVYYLATGGPLPSADGAIHIKHFYAGERTSDGSSFRKAYLGFDDGLVKPFSAHLLNCFPPDRRAARSIVPSTGSLVADPDVAESDRIGDMDRQGPADISQLASGFPDSDQGAVEGEGGNAPLPETDWDELGRLCLEFENARPLAHAEPTNLFDIDFDHFVSDASFLESEVPSNQSGETIFSLAQKNILDAALLASVGPDLEPFAHALGAPEPADMPPQLNPVITTSATTLPTLPPVPSLLTSLLTGNSPTSSGPLSSPAGAIASLRPNTTMAYDYVLGGILSPVNVMPVLPPNTIPAQIHTPQHNNEENVPATASLVETEANKPRGRKRKTTAAGNPAPKKARATRSTAGTALLAPPASATPATATKATGGKKKWKGWVWCDEDGNVVEDPVGER
ncbi:hypothetical protein GALMADRAFT_216697 [Galerina marginata CBS 339.88]|uniref:Uncharacterized protein n=1 Tax=Galerina marginata (strain CBS 339.88) TaxID=685588 RepID=A0A067SH38_GALM3|nr:hypothetical protein GALMADRAFT_216697 [Galerina marginata CBS 339.88]